MINVFYIGRLGGDAEKKTAVDGDEYVTFRACTDKYVSDKKGRVPVWTSVSYPGKIALKMFPYFKKGTMVEITGTLSVSAYITRDGAPAPSLDVRASRVSFVATNRSSGETSDDSDCGSFTKKDEAKKEIPAAKVETPKFPPTVTDDDDDLPF